MHGEKQEHEENRDATIEREARAGRQFSMADALLHAAGGGLMRGGTPVSPGDQARHEIRVFLDRSLSDPVLETAIDGWLDLHTRYLETHEDNPLQALLELLEHTLGNESDFTEFVRQVDFQYGRIMQEKPHFQQPGEAPEDGDAYTLASVRADLLKAVEELRKST